jgi:hypothetical protein
MGAAVKKEGGEMTRPYRFLFGFRSILPLILMPTLPFLLFMQEYHDRKLRKRAKL